jgi:hypothetical protein
MKIPHHFRHSIMTLCVMIILAGFITGQSEANYDEEQVPAYELPSILVAPGGKQEVTTVEQWENTRRKELLTLFANEMYGEFPGQGIIINFILNESEKVFNDKALRKEVTINLRAGERELDVSLLLYVPLVSMQVPVFLGLNFYGNHTINADPGISIHRSWVKNNEAFGIVNNRASEKNRGVRAYRWPVEYIIDQGFGLATMYYGEIDPDFDDDFENGIHGLIDQKDKSKLSSLSAWAWMMSQALTYLQEDPNVRSDQIAVIGHSRLGKAALWAGALDERFALVVSNDSGCGGAALSRRKYGETINRINNSFPHWFADAFNKYKNAEETLPFDQHTLLSLIAPRPLYVASAEDDKWADPKGEFLASQSASVVYDLYGLSALNGQTMPEVDQPIIGHAIGYHIRSGGHDLTQYDWEQFIAFAKKQFDKK